MAGGAFAGHTALGLATQTGIPRTTLVRKLRKPQTLTLDEVTALARVTGEDPEALAARLLQVAA